MLAKERMSQYGLNSLSTDELLNLVGFTDSEDDFYQSDKYALIKEIVNREKKKEIILIRSSVDSYNYFKFLEVEPKEELHVLFLNNQNKVIYSKFFSKGSSTGTVVDIQEIIREGINCRAKFLVLCHNHPSGNTNPSPEDRTITRRLSDAANFFEMKILDHIIIANNSYYSFADNENL